MTERKSQAVGEDPYFSDVVESGQLEQLGENVQRGAQEAAKLLISAVEIQCHLLTQQTNR